ncbi:MAG: aromatic amino acid transport family protein [bacterium]
MFGYNKNFFFALSVLIGTIVGAGIFGMPYVVSKSGIIPGFFYFFILGGAVLLIHLCFGEIILRTDGQHRLAGYAQKYLGKSGKILAAFSLVAGLSGALLAYLILAGDFLKILLSSALNLSSFHYTLILGLILSYFVFRGIKLIAPTEVLTNIVFFFIILVVFSFCLPQISVSNFVLFDPPNIFLPYGVILFSLIGWSAIPEMTSILKTREERKGIKKIIFFSSAAVLVFYVLFNLGIIGVTGRQTSPDVFSGLLPFLGEKIIFLGALAGLITIIDSFLVLALHLKNVFVYDFKLSKTLAFFTASGLPLLLFLIGFRSFIGTLGFVGTIIGVIEGVLIILIFRRAKTLGDREPEYSLKIPSFLLRFLIFILILGAILQFIF